MSPGRTKRRPREAKILPFMPRNAAEAPGTPAARSEDELPSWGPNLDWPQITASNWQPIERGRLFGSCTLTIPHWRLAIAKCHVIRFRANWLRVFLPDQHWRGDYKTFYTAIFHFLTDDDARDFEEAALRAVRLLLKTVEREKVVEAEKCATALDDVPF